MLLRKNLYLFIGIILIGLFACSSAEKDYLPPLKIEVPDNLKDNAEAVSFISETSKALNQWSISLEDLVVECKPYIEKEESELSAIEKLKLGKIMMEFVANMGQFAVKIAEIEQNATTIEYNLNEDQLEAMTAIMTQFENRVSEINAKYQDFGKEE